MTTYQLPRVTCAEMRAHQAMYPGASCHVWVPRKASVPGLESGPYPVRVAYGYRGQTLKDATTDLASNAPLWVDNDRLSADEIEALIAAPCDVRLVTDFPASDFGSHTFEQAIALYKSDPRSRWLTWGTLGEFQARGGKPIPGRFSCCIGADVESYVGNRNDLSTLIVDDADAYALGAAIRFASIHGMQIVTVRS